MSVFKYHAFIYFMRPPPWYGTLTIMSNLSPYCQLSPLCQLSQNYVKSLTILSTRTPLCQLSHNYVNLLTIMSTLSPLCQLAHHYVNSLTVMSTPAPLCQLSHHCVNSLNITSTRSPLRQLAHHYVNSLSIYANLHIEVIPRWDLLWQTVLVHLYFPCSCKYLAQISEGDSRPAVAWVGGGGLLGTDGGAQNTIALQT
jgi:hypothetical protein